MHAGHELRHVRDAPLQHERLRVPARPRVLEERDALVGQHVRDRKNPAGGARHHRRIHDRRPAGQHRECAVSQRHALPEPLELRTRFLQARTFGCSASAATIDTVSTIPVGPGRLYRSTGTGDWSAIARKCAMSASAVICDL